MFHLNESERSLVENNSSSFYKILKNCLNIKNEPIMIISDYGEGGNNLALMLAYGYHYAARKKGLISQLLIQDVKKGFMQADSNVIKGVTSLPKNSIVIVSVSNKLGKFGEVKSFRKFCNERGHRFLSASGLGDAENGKFPIFMEAMNINYKRMQKQGENIKKQFDKAKEIQVITDIGTNLKVNVEGMEAISNAGEYLHPGKGGNMPAGEVYIAPKGMNGVNGVVVLDGSIRHYAGSKLLKYLLKLEIKEGRIVGMSGPEANILEETFEKFEARAKYPERVRLIGELGIGINPGAVLIGLALMDEKVDGTAHIGVGSNSWFGGSIKTIFHGDMTFKNPTFYIDGKKLNM